MTTQAVKATVGSGTFSKIFTLTATDDQWDGNSLTDSISNQPLGILIPKATINNCAMTYTEGLAAWRIQSAQTLQVKRLGFSSPAGFSVYNESMIQPYAIQPDDILSVYPLPIDTDATHSNCLAWVATSKGTELFEAKNIVDATSTAMTTVVNNQSLGDNQFGTTMREIMVQAEDGATVNQVDILDNSGAVVFTALGGTRADNGGSQSSLYNLHVKGLAIPIGRGFSLKVTTTSA